MEHASGWLPDPFEHHEMRYWLNGQWTSHVADGATLSKDEPQPNDDAARREPPEQSADQ